MAVQSDCKALHVRLLNSFTAEVLSGECKFWMGRCDSVECTPDRVAHAVFDWNTGGLARIIYPDRSNWAWDKAVVFLLPNTVVPLDRFTDLSENIVREEDGSNWLTLEVIVMKQ